MGLIASYNLRSMIVRKGTAAMTAMGIAMVVAVFVMTMAIAQGFRGALVASGSNENAILLRKGATSETVSAVLRPQLSIIEALPQIARARDGHPLASPELVVIISLPRQSDNKPANVPLRGVGPRAFEIRNTLEFVEGRRLTPGMREINVGKQAVGRFKGLTLGSDVKFGNTAWKVVGIFTADDASFESEVWGDVELMMPAFQRGGYQSVTLRLKDPASVTRFHEELSKNPRMQVQLVQERKYYDDQSAQVSGPLMALAVFVALVMGVGAIFGAMNTMYGIVAARTREIGTLRALGFSRAAILISFVTESTMLALIGGVLGCLIAIPANGITSAAGGANFAEVSFAFQITTPTIVAGLVLAVLMGFAGGLLPAWRASRVHFGQSESVSRGQPSGGLVFS